MTQLLQRLREELVRRDYAATTIRSYLQIVDAFRQHTGARLDRITPAQLRRYHLFLHEERRLAIGTVVTQICALRFFCRYVLHRRDVREDLPYPKERHRLPVVLSPDEVRRLDHGRPHRPPRHPREATRPRGRRLAALPARPSRARAVADGPR